MLVGVAGHSLVSDLKNSKLLQKKKQLFLESNDVIMGLVSTSNTSAEQHLWILENKNSGLVWEGEIDNWNELKNGTRAEHPGEILWHLYQKQGTALFERMNGAFSLALWDASKKILVLARDALGQMPLYYTTSQNGFSFSNALLPLVGLREAHEGIHFPTVMKYLTFCYNPGTETFFKGIHKLRPGHYLIYKEGRAEPHRYWSLAFKNIQKDENIIGEAIRNELTNAVERRVYSRKKTGAFLSGGLDSSSIVSLLHQLGQKEMTTFSFRCKGKSFDESHYAKIVAKTFGAKHHIVEYGPKDVLLAQEMVSFMDEPFCDVGINIGTYLLAKKAAGMVDTLFTGDGGDELFAGHPVYVADQTARIVKKIPNFLLQPVFALGRKLPDSENKKDWKVKFKRFSESYRYPQNLGTHRWRVYYHPTDLMDLMVDHHLDESDFHAIYDDIDLYYREANGVDTLSRTLSCDYQTVVQFYLQRMALVRAFGMVPKIPMLDPNVVAYCATVPSNLKIHGFSDVKYIERVAVEPLLPHEIVHRKDKLGHSIPLKNWMRDDAKVKNFMLDLLSEENIKTRGWFDASIVQNMISEHMERRVNHSHRLWALMILELWMQTIDKRKNFLNTLEESE